MAVKWKGDQKDNQTKQHKHAAIYDSTEESKGYQNLYQYLVRIWLRSWKN